MAKAEESRSGRAPHGEPQFTLDNTARAIELVQEGPRCRRSVACSRPRWENHACGDSHRRFAHHAERLDGRRQRTQSDRRSPASLWVYVEDCDALFNRAVSAGARVPPEPCGSWRISSGATAANIHRPARIPVDDRDAQGRSHATGNEAAHRRLHEELRGGAAAHH